MQIFEELWNGQVCPSLEPGYQDEEYHDLEELLAYDEGKLLPTLNQTQLEDFKKIKEIWGDMEHVSECAAFIKGFRLAVQLMTASV